MKIIGLHGKARCGKDTAAEYIHSNFEDVETYALADPLKRGAAEMFNIPLHHFYDVEFKEIPDEFWGISPREIAQKVGTECMRKVFREDFWLKRCESQMKTDPNIFIVTDVRFENEATWIRENGGVVIHIDRPELGEGIVREHASEAGIKQAQGDQRLLNDGSLMEFYAKVDALIKFLILESRIRKENP